MPGTSGRRVLRGWRATGKNNNLSRSFRYNDRTMQPDDELCLCFHVTKRKVINFLRIERPQRASQMAECYGAGTGCGWCRPYLKKLFDAAQSQAANSEATSAFEMNQETGATADLPSAEEYARGRTTYVRAGKGTPPPGATPIERE
jgi:bacterioferritin-associated ferredoxin